MSAKKKHMIPDQYPLSTALDIWKYLTTNAGIDSIVHDKELLSGNTSEGLYYHLGITNTTNDFEKDLLAHHITPEQFIIAFFRTLQPYSQMMSDLCTFFERHIIKETDNKIKINFDFGQLNADELDFDLEHFREILTKFTNVQRLVEVFSLTSNELWPLIKIFGNQRVKCKNIAVRKWVEDYHNNRPIFHKPIPAIPVTGNSSLDKQFQRIAVIWSSFISTCNKFGKSKDDFEEAYNLKIGETENPDPDTMPWNANELYSAERDGWPATMLELMFFKIEAIDLLPDQEKNNSLQELAGELELFFDKLPVSEREENELLEELTDLLNLPYWKKRYELYAAWILSLLDQLLINYNRVYHTVNGKLSLTFNATLLATIHTVDGPVELWSEVRSPVENPAGKSRENSIQPDYIFYKELHHQPDKAIICIEVKQYFKPSRSNFSDALNDYTKGLVNAHVFLANYGIFPADYKLNLDTPERSGFFGNIRPSSPDNKPFINAVKKHLPDPHKPCILPLIKTGNFIPFDTAAIHAVFNDELKCVYIDISQSLDTPDYKAFIETLLNKALIYPCELNEIVAVDTKIRYEKSKPEARHIEELIMLSFDDATEFENLLKEPYQSIGIITDEDGVKRIEDSDVDPMFVIKYLSGGQAEIR